MQVGADLFLTSAPIYRVASSIVRLTGVVPTVALYSVQILESIVQHC